MRRRVPSVGLDREIDSAAPRRELDRVRQQVPRRSGAAASRSPRTTTGVSGMRDRRARRPWRARPTRSPRHRLLRSVRRATWGAGSSCSSPVSAFDTSSRSPVSCAWSLTLRSIDSSPRPDVSRSSLPVRSRCTQPSTAFSGVRSSCETVARNSSFIRFAASPSRRAACATRACCSAGAARRPQFRDHRRQQQPLDDEQREMGRRRASTCESLASKARARRPARWRPAPGRCRRTMRSPARPFPAAGTAAVVDPRRPASPQTRTPTTTAASAIAKRRGAGKVGNG